MTVRASCLALIAVSLAQGIHAQPVVEGIHQDRHGPPTLCGISGANIAAIEITVANDESFVEEGSDARYRVFNRNADFVQFVFPRPATYSFPVATCRKVKSRADGTFIERELTCDGTRQECDEVFRQFEELDNRVKEEMRG